MRNILAKFATRVIGKNPFYLIAQLKAQILKYSWQPLQAYLTLPFAPFGRSGRVTQATVIG